MSYDVMLQFPPYVTLTVVLPLALAVPLTPHMSTTTSIRVGQNAATGLNDGLWQQQSVGDVQLDVALPPSRGRGDV